VTIRADNSFIVAVPGEDSDIIANASKGRGGNIQITTQGIFGIEERRTIPGNGTNDIDASSQFGVNGVVTINTLDVDPSQGLVNLPNEPVDVEVAQGCQAGGEQASVAFFNTGRGGLPPNPYEPLSHSELWEDVPLSTQRAENPAGASSASTSPVTAPNKIVEAQGWLYNEKGEVVLAAQMPATHSQGRCRLH
jgi:large exoprotein involved in heme utilization and adhesion